MRLIPFFCILFLIFADMRRFYLVLLSILLVCQTKAQLTDVLCEDTCSHIHGIDLSHYQGDVFWEIIGKNTKMTYVYLKASEGGDRVDEKYQGNMDLAKQYGLKVGSYHFYRPLTPQKAQLKNFLAQCKPEVQDLIPMIDIETTSRLSTEVFLDSLHKFLDLVEEAYGTKPLVYTFTNFYNRHLQHELPGYQLMIAQYSDLEPTLADDRDITMWQYTGKGRIDGINTFVDKSRMMGRHGLREIRYRYNK